MKHLKTKRVGPVVVLSPQKSLYGDDETFDLQEAIHQNHKEGNRFLVINLAEVEQSVVIAQDGQVDIVVDIKPM